MDSEIDVAEGSPTQSILTRIRWPGQNRLEQTKTRCES